MLQNAIIFDLDGTLLDASQPASLGWNQGLKQLKIKQKITPEDIRQVSGQPFKDCLQTILPDHQQHPELETIINQFEQQELKQQPGQLYPGVQSALPKLAKKYPLFIVSNCQDWYLDNFLKHFNFEQYLHDHNCHGRSQQPKHTMLTDLIEEHQLEDATYIGDTLADAEASREAGLNFIHAAYGFGEVEGHDQVFHSFSDLSSHLLSKELLP